MGKASSAKKVARAARAGGGRVRGMRQRNIMFPGAITAIIFLGSALVFFAWNDRSTEASSEPPRIGQHWHAAFGFYICDAFQPNLPEFPSDQIGIHSHADGVIHIHPHGANGAGDNATLGTFLDEAGVELTDNSLTIGDQTWTEGEDNCGETPGRFVVVRWEDVQSEDSEPTRIYSDFTNLRFRGDGEGYTIAFVPEGTADIPKPETAAQLTELGAADGSSEGQQATTSSVAPGGDPAASVPVDPAATSIPVDPAATAPTSAAPPADGG
jgi:hypothetical protein